MPGSSNAALRRALHEKLRKGKCWVWTGTLSRATPVHKHEGKIRTVVGLLSELEGRPINKYVNQCGNFRCCKPSHQHRYFRQETVEVPTARAYTPPQRSKTSLTTEVDAFAGALVPLLHGKPAKLFMTLPRKHSKMKGDEERLVVIVPGQMLGEDRMVLMLSVIGRGSTVVRVDQPKKLANLVLAGIPARLAGALMDKLHRLFQEK